MSLKVSVGYLGSGVLLSIVGQEERSVSVGSHEQCKSGDVGWNLKWGCYFASARPTESLPFDVAESHLSRKACFHVLV